MGTKKVLVVEDDSAIRRGLVDALRFHGYEVLERADGASMKVRAPPRSRIRSAASLWRVKTSCGRTGSVP